MVYGFRCVFIDRPIWFMTFSKMRLFWLVLSIMNCNEEPFTHIYQWKRNSPSFGTSGSFFSILVVATVALSSVSMIWFHFSFPFLGSDSESEHAFDSKAFSSATSVYLIWHSLVLWVELLWNSHHLPVSFVFKVFFFACSFSELCSVFPPWLWPFLYGLDAPFPCFEFTDPKSHFICLNFFSILTTYWYAVPSEEMSKNSISS